MTKIKTIDIQAREWFDKINGNSYFAGDITINYGMKGEKNFTMPFQYGYGNHYQDMAMELLNKNKLIDTHSTLSLWRYCQENKIILRADKQENCLKRELKS
jgi:hypothetical protein